MKQENKEYSNKDLYREFCQKHPEIPLFAQYWWMEAICIHKKWDVFIFKDDRENIIATMPYMVLQKLGKKIILQPLFSQTNGIWFNYEFCKEDKKTFEQTICLKAIKKIKELHVIWFIQFFPSEFNCYSPFQQAGYEISQRRTYVIKDIANPNLLKLFTPAKQRHIRKAERNGLYVDFSMTPEEFQQYHTETLRQRGMKNQNPTETEINICKQAIERGNGAIISIFDKEGSRHSALFFVWDEKCAYYLIPAISHEYKSSGASTLMVWEAIKFLQGKTKSFDFEGSMDENIANSYKQFATEEVSYPQIEKISSLLFKIWKRFR